jgi:hypothetical protein
MKIITKGFGSGQLIVTRGYGKRITEVVITALGKPLYVFKRIIRKG